MDTLPAWVLPGYALLLAVIAFLIYIIWKQGGKLADMVSEKTVQGIFKLVLDAAADIAKRTPTAVDDTLIGLVRGEVTGAQTTTTTVTSTGTATPPAGSAG